MTDHGFGGALSSVRTPDRAEGFPLTDVVVDGSIGGVFVGARARHIHSRLGPPRSDPARVSRRSPIVEHDYGNTSVLIHRDWVVGITIEPTQTLEHVVSTHAVDDWSSAQWLEHLGSTWRLVPFLAHVQLIGPTAALAFDDTDRLHVVTLAPRAVSVGVRHLQ